MLNIIDGEREAAFGIRNHPVGHFARRKAGVEPDDADDGMLMSGKMSVGVRRIVSGVRRIITSAITINVYGRLRAKETIHMGGKLQIPAS